VHRVARPRAAGRRRRGTKRRRERDLATNGFATGPRPFANAAHAPRETLDVMHATASHKPDARRASRDFFDRVARSGLLLPRLLRPRRPQRLTAFFCFAAPSIAFRLALASDEPQSSRRRLSSRLLRPVDASVRRPTDLALGPRPSRASDVWRTRRSRPAGRVVPTQRRIAFRLLSCRSLSPKRAGDPGQPAPGRPGRRSVDQRTPRPATRNVVDGRPAGRSAPRAASIAFSRMCFQYPGEATDGGDPTAPADARARRRRHDAPNPAERNQMDFAVRRCAAIGRQLLPAARM
jgi:hypothetical protein